MQIKHKKTEDLIPYDQNAKLHPDSQVARIARSIQEFGFRNPVLVDVQGEIIAGHGRVMAAKYLGLDQVPTITADGLTPEQVRAYRIADNKLAESDWDWDLLKKELTDLNELGFGLDITGFEEKEIGTLIEKDVSELSDVDAEPEIDKQTELIKKWGVKPGQIWELGMHRLLCGDSTNQEDINCLMEDKKALLCFTSPPYLQQRDYTQSSYQKVQDWDHLMQGVFSCIPMRSDGQIIVNLGMIHRDREWIPYWDDWIEWMRKQGWKRFGLYVWDQGAGMMGDWQGRLAPSHEMLFHFSAPEPNFLFHFNEQAIKPQKFVDTKKSSQKKKKRGDKSTRKKDGDVKEISSPEKSGQPKKIPDSVVRISRNATNDMARNNHPATFPVQLPEYFIRCWPGLTFEPFNGAGSTIIAAERVGWPCRAIEIEPGYVAVTLQRFTDATGKTPIMKKENK